MKHTTLSMVVIFTLSSPFNVIAQEAIPQAITTDTFAADSETSAPAGWETPCPMQGKGMAHTHRCHHGKGHAGKKHSCKHDRKAKHERHRQMVQRMDMIEARLAKIEAMLESLMRR